MECITVQEAAEKWDISVRRVQYLCNHGMIPGAARFGKVWTIPKEAERPKDGRYKGQEEQRCSSVQPSQSISAQEEMFRTIVEKLPYPMHICKSDGTLVFANEAFLRFVRVSNPEKIYGKHNVLDDPDLEKWGIKEYVLKAYQGEIVQVYDIKVPVQELVDKFSDHNELVYESLFHNITSFPIYDDYHKLSYVATIFVISRYYYGKEEIRKAKEYIESHWLEKFDIGDVAGAVNLSRYHFTRLFKKHTGMTPYAYYQDVKISKLKEKLCDENLSIGQAFADCGVEYNGNFARIFKEKVGMTPSKYKVSVIEG